MISSQSGNSCGKRKRSGAELCGAGTFNFLRGCSPGVAPPIRSQEKPCKAGEMSRLEKDLGKEECERGGDCRFWASFGF